MAKRRPKKQNADTTEIIEEITFHHPVHSCPSAYFKSIMNSDVEYSGGSNGEVNFRPTSAFNYGGEQISF